MAAISNQVGAAEYTLVAVVLIANSIDDLGLKLLDQAVRAAADANDLTGALRYSASRRFELGDAFQGRLFYDRATHVFDVGVFPSKDAGYVIVTQFDTQASWAFSELHYGTCDLAKEHFADAKRLSDVFPATDPRRAQMAAFEADVTACQPRPDPTSSPSPAVTP